VRPGDTLSAIAQSACGDAADWPSLAAASGIHTPNRIYPGQRVVLACGAVVRTAAAPSAAPHRDRWDGQHHACGDGDGDGFDMPCSLLHHGWSDPPGSFAASTHAAVHRYGCGDGDGDGYDLPCWKLHAHTATTPSAPAPQSPVAYSAPAAPAPGGIWGCIAQHESGGNPAENTGNGFYGAFQFTAATWAAVTGLPGTANEYSYATQLAAAQKLQASSGWGNWPVTSVACGAG